MRVYTKRPINSKNCIKNRQKINHKNLKEIVQNRSMYINISDSRNSDLFINNFVRNYGRSQTKLFTIHRINSTLLYFEIPKFSSTSYPLEIRNRVSCAIISKNPCVKLRFFWRERVVARRVHSATSWVHFYRRGPHDKFTLRIITSAT